jgi:hypothetical protein
MAGGAQKLAEDRGGFLIRVPASGQNEELHGVFPPMIEQEAWVR